MLTDTLNILKIADFGFAAPTEGRDGGGMLETYLGTPNHMAPEINEGKDYDGVKVDIFACGVILFIMTTGLQPFGAAKKND